jgi:hypothetical protein
MGIRVAFVAGWLWSHFLNWSRGPGSLPEETLGLREEIRAARLALGDFQEVQRSLEWKIWAQGWVIRFNLGFHVFCLIWFCWVTFARPKTQLPPLQISDLGGSSSETDESAKQVVVRPAGRGKFLGNRVNSGRGRPTRPSDLK